MQACLPESRLHHTSPYLLPFPFATHMATVADDPSAPGLPSAHSSQLRTCIVCRQRRVKCDRRLPRCSSCVRSDAHCIYPSGRGRAPKRPRREVTTPQLSERLSRLESIISQLGASTTTTGSTTRRSTLSASPITHEAGENYGRSFDEDFSRLKVDDLESYYVNNPLWVKLADEVTMCQLPMWLLRSLIDDSCRS